MKSIVFFLMFSVGLVAQTTISGKVVDKLDKPIVGVNVFIEGSYDGALTDDKGEFRFTTSEKGTQTLKFTKVGLDDHFEVVEIENYRYRIFNLMKNKTNIEAVTITAGTIKAGDNSKVSTLKALDIVTTAGSMGDIVSALETMPGVQSVGESGRLFVRGGEAGETQTYVDGIRVAQPYGVSPANVPTRTRFSPFLFKGITFSTGGYSAEFGNALSSVLLLNTIDDPAQNQTDVSIMTVGVGLGKSKKWENSSLTFNTSYINLKPYYFLVPQSLDWNKAPETFGGEMVYRTKIKNGLFKWYAALDHSSMDINQKDINYAEKLNFKQNNTNFYSNSSFKGKLTDNLQLQTGLSYGYSINKIGINADKLNNDENALHYKLKLRQSFGSVFKWNAGGEYFYTKFNEKYTEFTQNPFAFGYENNTIAFFSEAELYFSNKLAFNIGLRSSKSTLMEDFTLEPRLSMAYKLGENSQISAAYGNFNQMPNQDYLKFTTKLEYEKTNHYIFNYLYNKNGKMLRLEGYFKDYNNLIKYDTNSSFYNSNFTNNGIGYAKGIDVFWRDNKSVKYLDYWISYSYIDTERNFKNYTSQVTPSFVANHNFSIVTKYWINTLKSQLSTTYSFNSGRPYNNPNQSEFMNEKTKSYNNFSLSWSYLLSQQKILFFSVSNMLGADNIFGYQYANSPDSNGVFQRQAITQPASRFFFVGFFWTISDNKKSNQLDNL